MLYTLGVIVVAFLGLIAGYWLQEMAKEELQTARPYLIWLQRIILLILVIMLLYATFQVYPRTIPFYGAVIISGVLGFFAARKWRKRYFYLGLAMVMAVLLETTEALLITSSLVFLYGLPFGSTKVTKGKWSEIGMHALLFVLPLLLLVVRPFIRHHYLVLAFIAGALFLRD